MNYESFVPCNGCKVKPDILSIAKGKTTILKCHCRFIPLEDLNVNQLIEFWNEKQKG